MVSQGKRPFMGWILVQLRLCVPMSAAFHLPQRPVLARAGCVCSPFPLIKRPWGPLGAHGVAQANHLQKKSLHRQEVSRALGLCLCSLLLKTLVCWLRSCLDCVIQTCQLSFHTCSKVKRWGQWDGSVGWKSLQLNPETRVQSSELT